MIDGRLFQEDIQFAHFERLRKEDPVHLNELPGFGRYWSITKFEDIMFVDKNHQMFSSAHGITIGPQIPRKMPCQLNCVSECLSPWTRPNMICNGQPLAAW